MPALPVALVDASARGRSCDNYYRWRKYRATGEELWATTDEPYVFFVCNMGSAITIKPLGIFLFSSPEPGLERELRAVLI
jgi:hypothetical protein